MFINDVISIDYSPTKYHTELFYLLKHWVFLFWKVGESSAPHENSVCSTCNPQGNHGHVTHHDNPGLYHVIAWQHKTTSHQHSLSSRDALSTFQKTVPCNKCIVCSTRGTQSRSLEPEGQKACPILERNVNDAYSHCLIDAYVGTKWPDLVK